MPMHRVMISGNDRRNLNLPRHLERQQVKGRLAWYAKNQKYLDRVAARGSLYLHYIVGEVEKRACR